LRFKGKKAKLKTFWKGREEKCKKNGVKTICAKEVDERLEEMG